MKHWLTSIVLALALAVGLSSFVPVHAQSGPYSAQIQSALRSFVLTDHTWSGTQTFTNVTVNGTCTGCGISATDATFINTLGLTATTSNTSDSHVFPIFVGQTSAQNYYAKAWTSLVQTLAGNANRTTANLTYYQFAPTDSDASGVTRVGVFGYLETGGSQNLSSSLQAVRGRVLHLGTGTAGVVHAVDGNAFVGHAGAQGSTGGSVTELIAGNFQTFVQSTAATVTAAYGVNALVEADYATAVTNAYGGSFSVTLANGTPVTNAYGVYIDGVAGTNAWGLYQADATASNHFSGMVEFLRGTLTTSSPWTFTQTWNSAGTTFEGLKETITQTAAANTSSFFTIASDQGHLFSVQYDNVSAGGGSKVVCLETNDNATASAQSYNWAIRIAADQVSFTGTCSANGTRQVFASTFEAGSNWTANATAVLHRSVGVELSTTAPKIQWSSTADVFGTVDAVLRRSAAKTLTFDSDGAGAALTLLAVKGPIDASTQYNVGGNLLCSATAPTRSSGFGTNADASFATGSTACAFDLNIGTGGVPTSGVLNMPTAAHGWMCQVHDATTIADNTYESAYTNNTVTLTTTVAWTANDHIYATCLAF